MQTTHPAGGRVRSELPGSCVPVGWWRFEFAGLLGQECGELVGVDDRVVRWDGDGDRVAVVVEVELEPVIWVGDVEPVESSGRIEPHPNLSGRVVGSDQIDPRPDRLTGRGRGGLDGPVEIQYGVERL